MGVLNRSPERLPGEGSERAGRGRREDAHRCECPRRGLEAHATPRRSGAGPVRGRRRSESGLPFPRPAVPQAGFRDPHDHAKWGWVPLAAEERDVWKAVKDPRGVTGWGWGGGLGGIQVAGNALAAREASRAQAHGGEGAAAPLPPADR